MAQIIKPYERYSYSKHGLLWEVYFEEEDTMCYEKKHDSFWYRKKEAKEHCRLLNQQRRRALQNNKERFEKIKKEQEEWATHKLAELKEENKSTKFFSRVFRNLDC